MRYIYTHEDAGRHRLGGKAEALAALHELDVPIPPWFVLAPTAFTDSLTSSAWHALANGDYATALRDLTPSVTIRAELTTALDTLLGTPAFVAVRSSALEEDGTRHSFAGQLESFLFVRPDDLAAKVVAVWRSAFSARVLAYRRERGLTARPTPPAVLIQQMVPADRAGVAFSADPATGRRGVTVVSAVVGLGSALVDGVAEADTYEVDRSGRVTQCSVEHQVTAHWPDAAGGVQAIVLPSEQGATPVLHDHEAQAVAALARRLEQHAGCPQDVEWALEGETLWLLQTRPITTLAGMPDPDAPVSLWDNSNIAESYNGVTTPLTFSFARRAYEAVYQSFCRLMGVPEARLQTHAGTFRSMIGLVRGRIYYNLLSWYDALALLPGFRFNRTFMEDMMGVRERLPDHLLPKPEPASRWERLRDGWHLTRSLIRLVGELFRLPKRTATFYTRLDAALTPPPHGLERLRLDELAAQYRHLEAELLTRWDAPLVNDFFAMIFFGLSKQLVEAWGPADSPNLHNNLLCGEGGIVSVEPVRLLRQMAELAADDSDLTHALAEGSLDTIQHALAERPVFNTLYQSYLDRFSDRCLDELKLESPTLRDEPLVLLRTVGTLARRLPTDADAPLPSDPAETTLREQAEEQMRTALRRHPLRRLVLGRILKQARTRVVNRENLRFERTRVFGTTRRLFVEMGRRLYAEGALDDAQDVFYLEVDEVLGFVEGTATTADLRGLARVRNAEFDTYRTATPPPDRFLARGAVHANSRFEAVTSAPAASEMGECRQGLGCGPGVVRGRVRIIRDPRRATLEHGEILVAERTDPGWIVLFTACSGLIVERGSLLSHAAIVARELGLPAVVSLPQATIWLKDGDLVELDGHTGTVRKLVDEKEEVFSDGETIQPSVLLS